MNIEGVGPMKVSEIKARDATRFRADDFIIPASDTNGHNARQYFRAQPGHAQQVSIFVGSKRFPYRTKGDLLRHAMVRHLKWLAELEGTVPSVMSQVDAIMEVARHEEFQIEFRQVFNKVGEVINSLMASGDENEARRFLLRIGRNIKDMPPEDHRKKKYEDELDRRFGHIIKSAPKANLHSLKKDR